jgi:hypothetical protein
VAGGVNVGSGVFENENVGSGVKTAWVVSAMCIVAVLAGGGALVSDRTTEFCEQAERINIKTRINDFCGCIMMSSTVGDDLYNGVPPGIVPEKSPTSSGWAYRPIKILRAYSGRLILPIDWQLAPPVPIDFV